MRRSDAFVVWDEDDDPDGNVRHIAEHDLTPEEVESVLLDDTAEDDVSRSSGRPIVRGETHTGGGSSWPTTSNPRTPLSSTP